MEGFFTKKETASKSRPDGKLYTCYSCGLFKNCESPKMQPFGKFKKKILIIGEAPGDSEDQIGKPWQGTAGRLLQKTFRELGINLFEDCLNVNAVWCRPTDSNNNNRAPSNYEVECCRRYILKVISERKPKVIILLGNKAVYSLIGYVWKKNLGGITKWRGYTIPDQNFNAWVCPTFHPSFIQHSENNKYATGVEKVIWKQDLKEAFAKLNEPFLVHKKPTIKIITDLYELSHIKTNIAFDYETTGIKPHAIGHRIVCCSIATSENYVYVFMMPKSKRERQPFINILEDESIGKIAQNMKYEDTWSMVRLRTKVKNWIWDTMQAAHILDNRVGITSLAFQVYVQFGIVDFKDETDVYLKSTKEKGGNAMNKIMELVAKPGGEKLLMTRCAYDSIYEYRLAMIQRKIIGL